MKTSLLHLIKVKLSALPPSGYGLNLTLFQLRGWALLAAIAVTLAAASPARARDEIYGPPTSLAYVTPARAPSSVEPLRLRNDFEKPEDVVRYYAARDAGGFVWSGMIDAERRAFTEWREAPNVDSFFLAAGYEVLPGEISKDADHAQVKVRYKIKAIADANGMKAPAEPTREVAFELHRTQGRWRIQRPAPGEMAPTLVEGRAPASAVAATVE